MPREGPTVTLVQFAADAPVAQGGQILTGKYYLTTWQEFHGAGGPAGPTIEMRKATVLITNGMFQHAESDVEEGVDDPLRAETFTANGVNLALSELCPTNGRVRDLTYTAVAGQLTLYQNFGAFTAARTYQRQ